MKLEELMGEDAVSAREALKMVELDVQHGSDMNEVIDILDTRDHVEIIKGLCYVVNLLASIMCGGSSGDPVFIAIRNSTDEAAANGNDATTNYKVLDLIEATKGHGGSFYLQAYSLKEPSNEILGLITLFQNLAKNALGKEVEEVTEFLHNYIDETYNS